jgi:hypothetical protein
MRFVSLAGTVLLVVALAGACDTMKKNPRTTGTIGGAAAGAAIGAAVDKDHPGTGAVVGGAIGAGAGNAGGQVYKDRNKD